MMLSEKKTAIYIRLSSEDGNVDGCIKHESDSVSAQRILLKTFVLQELGVSEQDIYEYVDDGVSGTHFNRMGFQELQEDMKSGMLGCVVVKDFSRFGRDYLEVGFFIEYIFPLLQIRFISVNDGYDSQASSGMTGGMNVALKNLINNMYSLDLSKKITSAMQTRMKNGTRIPVQAKFGYQKNKEGRLEVDPEAAKIIKDIFKMAADGESFAEITRKLNKEKVPTIDEYLSRKGNGFNFQRFDTITKKMWSPTTVRKIIRDEIYLGVRIWGKSRCNMHTGHKTVLNDESDWIRIENSHEAIISQELFDAANAMHPYKKRGTAESRTNHLIPRKEKKHAFMICGHCGRSLINETAHILKCNACRNGGDSACENLSVRREELETTILEYVRSYAASFLGDKEKKVTNHSDREMSDKNELIAGMKRLSVQKMKLYDDYKDGYISREDYKIQAAKITEELASKQLELETISESADKVGTTEDTVTDDWKELAALQIFDKEKLQKIIRVIRVYSQDEIEIEWKCDDIFKNN